MRERLRRVGLRSISAVVDVTNYVMLELGQPHACLRSRPGSWRPRARRALAGERLTLLDGREIELTPDVLFIADEQRALGLAGVMGGQRTAISRETRDIVLEVAWFAPACDQRTRAPLWPRHRCQSTLRARRRLVRTGARARACDRVARRITGAVPVAHAVSPSERPSCPRCRT